MATVLTEVLRHCRSPRVLLTIAVWLYLFWEKITDGGDDLFEVLILAVLVIGLVLSWLIQLILAWCKPNRRYRRVPLLAESGVAIVLLMFLTSGLPFELAFPLSRPALERFVQTTPWSQNDTELFSSRTSGPKYVGILRVLSVRRRKDGHLMIVTHSNMSYAHTLTWYPERKRRSFTWENGFFGSQWERGSSGM